MRTRALDQPDVLRVSFTLSERMPIRPAINEERGFDEFRYDMHYELELGVVLDGRMERRFDRYTFDAVPGQVWLCGIWEPHGYRVTTETSRALVMVIRPELLAQLRFEEAPGRQWLAPFTAPPKSRPLANAEQRKAILEVASRFQKNIAELPSEERTLRHRLLLIELLLTLTRGWKAPADADSPASYYARINKAVELVFSQKRMVSAVEASKACGLSRNHFDRLFERLMGLSFAKFALRFRLGSAAAQLVRSEDALKKIAADWGFTDASHLVHCFQKHYGCAPLEYRRRKLSDALRESDDDAANTVAWNARL
ncbi:MAG TPA: helix-turn-helix transcriptional regulator [Planctomycetota bacterium]|nr:helix-turn-helix transcriptional regulator [Planctomycetota bacterium]